MQFAAYYLDRDDAGDIRQKFRDAHIAYRKGLGLRLLMAGPLLSDAGAPVGSLILLEAEDHSAAAGIANADPYVEAGLFKSVVVHGYRVMAMNLTGAS